MYQRSYPASDGIPPNYKGNAFDQKEGAIITEHKERESGLSSLFCRRDGSSFAIDDLILGGLIILLLNNHADDELLLILVLLFISGI